MRKIVIAVTNIGKSERIFLSANEVYYSLYMNNAKYEAKLPGKHDR